MILPLKCVVAWIGIGPKNALECLSWFVQKIIFLFVRCDNSFHHDTTAIFPGRDQLLHLGDANLLVQSCSQGTGLKFSKSSKIGKYLRNIIYPDVRIVFMRQVASGPSLKKV